MKVRLTLEEALDEIIKKYEDWGMDKFNPNEDFTDFSKIHNWRNHVDSIAKEYWSDLTIREKKIIFVRAIQEAQEEEWD